MPAISDKVDIDSQQVLRSIGYSTVFQPPARAVSLVNEYVESAYQLIEPLYSYVSKDIEWINGSIVFIEDSIIFKSEVIARLLEQCKRVAVFALTIGNHLEETVCHLTEDKLILRAAVLDAVGSAAVERLAGLVQKKIGEEAGAQGLCISRRFSPGYCDWDIGQQRMLFWALKGNTAEVRLTSSCLMIPQKSISGIVGLGTCDSNIENYNPCITCNKQDCAGRR